MRKLLCFIGWHRWDASLEDYLEEFNCVPLDGRIATKSICKFCGKKYKDT